MTACIFAGPTLPPGDGRDLAATWLPPAKHGDVYRAVTLLRPRAIGIVDGYFQWVPSVWHKEILWALEQGVHVFGASSMGALRAAELSSFGMRGVGRIFEAYRDGALVGCGDEPFEDDDEVAVVHGPPESGYISASEAMVNIRCTLSEAERAGVIGGATRSQLVAIAKALFFPDRSYELLLRRARDEGLPEAELMALHAWLPAGRIDQKRADAVAMLEAMRGFLAGDPVAARAGAPFEHTTLWDRALRALQPDTLLAPDETLALEELRLDRGRFRDLQREVFDALLASPHEHAAPDRGPAGAAANENWSDARPRLEEAARREAARRMKERIPLMLLERQMLSRVRATGEYAALLARAQDKRAHLAGRTDVPSAEDFSELQLLQLRDWYFSQPPGGDMPDDLEACLRELGYPDMMRFHEAVFAEYVYRKMKRGGATAGAAVGGGSSQGAE